MKPIPLLLTLTLGLLPVSSADEPATEPTITKTLNELNKRLTDAYEREDVPLLRKLLSERHVHNNVFGHRMTKEEFLADIESGTLVFESYETHEIQWFISEKTAVATGVIHARAIRAGKPVPATRFRFTRVYTLEDGQWQVLLFHNTLLPASP